MMRLLTIVAILGSGLAGATLVADDGRSSSSLPPVVVKTVPEAGMPATSTRSSPRSG